MIKLSGRASGVLMPISSLPSPYGIGTFGKSAYDFVDILVRAKQSCWQILPINPTGFADSPYQCFSTFAGNPYFIDLDMLCEDFLLSKSESDKLSWGSNAQKVDYFKIFNHRKAVFDKVYERFSKNIPADFEDFCRINSYWLDDYALFMAIKEKYGFASFHNWDRQYVLRDKKALDDFSGKYENRILCAKMLQYLFFKQWRRLKAYANANGIKIIGDIPIYVSSDSSDVWANRHVFCLDEQLRPALLAGCPPDGFSEHGQLWGNPVYDWQYLKNTEYDWWIKRIKASLEMYDILRIDHFRGFESYYTVSPESKTAENGVWRKADGGGLWDAVKKTLGDTPVIAEDLGFLTEDVIQFVHSTGFAGMKVLQFAFDSREDSDYLPHNYPKNCVVYTGTHDNDTLLGWLGSLDQTDKNFAMQYLRSRDCFSLCDDIMLCALASTADLCILPLWDLLHLGSSSRMNTPSTTFGNWQWRVTAQQLKDFNTDWLAYYTKLYARNNKKVCTHL